MAIAYRSVSTTAYRPVADADPWVMRYRALPFPEQAVDSLLTLRNFGRDPEKSPHQRIPTARLDSILQSLAPDLVVCRRDPEDSLHWLYVPVDTADPLPERVFAALIKAWMHDIRDADAVANAEYRALLEAVLSEIDTNPINWHDVEIDLLGCPVSHGGTATPGAASFNLATDALARRIAALDPYVFDTGELHFRALPHGPKQQGAELMSQPIERTVDGKNWWFSVTISITLHTVPFEPTPRVHIHTGVRRWATHPAKTTGRLRLPFRRNTSVYLRPSIPWLPGAPMTDRFAMARLGYNRKAGEVDWVDNGPAGLLHRLTMSQSFPEVADLLSNPEQWLRATTGVQAAVVHSNHMGEHGIGAGLMSNQRSQLMEWVEQALPPQLTRSPQLNRSTVGTHKPANARSTATGKAVAPQARRAAVATATRALDGSTVGDEPATLVCRLLWQSPNTRDAAISKLADILGLGAPITVPAADEFEALDGRATLIEWKTPELVVQLRCLPLAGGHGEKLAVDSGKRPDLAAAIGRRRADICSFIETDGGTCDHPTLALVEIGHRLEFTPTTDPKFAIRLGCADAGVLTQFVAVPSSARGIKNTNNVAHRVESAWLDGMRQLGVRVLPEHSLGTGLPDGLRYAALWMVKRRHDGPTRLPMLTPVAVLVTPIPGAAGYARVEGWNEDTSTWVPYPRYLLDLARRAVVADPFAQDGELPTALTYTDRRKKMDEHRRLTQSFVQKLMFDLFDAPTALIAHAQNTRQYWPWLQDGKLVPDLVQTGSAPPSGLQHNLRLIRVRGSAGRETPQWWGDSAPKIPKGLPAGLWVPSGAAPGSRVFYSTTEKASQFKASAVCADRLAPRRLTQGRNKGDLVVDAKTPAWNPALVEITVAGCRPGDNPEAFALAIHQLRQAPDYLDALSLPLPLHLAELVQEYVLPTETDGEDAGDGELPNAAAVTPQTANECEVPAT